MLGGRLGIHKSKRITILHASDIIFFKTKKKERSKCTKYISNKLYYKTSYLFITRLKTTLVFMYKVERNTISSIFSKLFYDKQKTQIHNTLHLQKTIKT